MEVQQQQILIQIVLDSWNSRVKEANKLFDGLSDDAMLLEVAPGKNRAIYLLGHLTAVSDLMLPLLDFEPQVYPEMNDVFLRTPDKTGAEIPTTQELRARWSAINAKLDKHIANLGVDEWFQKHTSVSAEDFAKEPHRNRLNVILSRTNHLSYHLGQVALIKK